VCSKANKNEGKYRQECVHYWYIEAKGKGKCKKCGAIRDFRTLLAWRGMSKFWGLECFYIPTEGVKLTGVGGSKLVTMK